MYKHDLGCLVQRNHEWEARAKLQAVSLEPDLQMLQLPAPRHQPLASARRARMAKR